jgi:hypothetical protein
MSNKSERLNLKKKRHQPLAMDKWRIVIHDLGAARQQSDTGKLRGRLYKRVVGIFVAIRTGLNIVVRD